ncbi:MAG: hypothetical protein J6X55_08525 [Victivallales bacterium]|nr:hypothetical protein [Victivallales bacterium]
MKNTYEKTATTVLKSLEMDRQRLLLRQPFIGMILMNLELVPMAGDLVKTACTDGRRIMMGIPFYAQLDLEERLFVMAHEAWHCVLMHGVRCQARNQHLFNIAADLEIHFVLQKEKMKEPFVLPHDPSWDGLSAEEIYEKLTQIDNGMTIDNGKQSEHIQGKTNGEGFDAHVFAGRINAEETKKAAKEELDNLSDTGFKEIVAHQSEIENNGEEANDEYLSGKEKTGNDRDNVSAIQKGDILDIPPWNSMFVEQMRRVVIQVSQTIMRRQGNLPMHIQVIVEALQKPELPWQELLRQFVTSCYGGSRRWLPPERRFVFRKLYLPSCRDSRLNAVMAIDTSCSTTKALPQFFTELSGLLNSFGKYDLTVIQCDSQIQHVESFSDARRLSNNYQWKRFGHCWTSFVPPFNYVREQHLKPDVFIYLTDGMGDAPDKAPQYPVIWVLTNGGEIPAKWGRCIRLNKSN